MRRRNNRHDTRALCDIGLDTVVDRRQLEELAPHTDVITVSRGTVLARAGASARQFVAIIDGTVDVTDSSGRTQIVGPGTHIGGIEVLDRRPHEATFVTRSAGDVVVITAQALASTFGHPGVADWIQEHRPVTPFAEALARSLALVD